MRLMHPTRLAAALLALAAAAPLAAQQPGAPTVRARAQAPGNGSTIVIWPRHIQTLQARLDSFAVALPAEERALWNGVLLRAANAPPPVAGEVRVMPVLEIGPGGGCEDSPGMTEAANRVAIIVQGGRTAGASGIVVQGGRTATPGAGIVVQGGRTPGQVNAAAPTGVRPAAPGDVRRPAEAVPINPRLQPVPWLALGRRLTELSSRLPAEERGVLNWLLTRAAAAEASSEPAAKEDVCVQPPGAQKMDLCWRPWLTTALGIEPTRARTEERWILRL